MKNINILAIKNRIDTVKPTLNEYQLRRYLSTEAQSLGHGGITLISKLSGLSRQTLTAGIKEINDFEVEPLPLGRCRKSGAGRKQILETQPGISEALEKLLSGHTKGDPMRNLLWTNKSLRTLEKELKAQGFQISYKTVGALLEMLGYTLQSNSKTLSITQSHPDRDQQFDFIDAETKQAVKIGNPVLSVDAKKKENIGNFKNDGRTYQKKHNPIEVLDHDFPILELGKAVPYGVYDVFKNRGFVSVGISAETAIFAVESIRKWWLIEGALSYSNASEIVITADCGGSNGYRNRLWKYELQKFANDINKTIRVLHYPPGTSKWNKIEHRLFSFISKNWQGIPLISTAVIISLIGATTTEKGLTVRCVLDESLYEKGLKVTEAEFESINIQREEFHGEWNYSIAPN